MERREHQRRAHREPPGPDVSSRPPDRRKEREKDRVKDMKKRGLGGRGKGGRERRCQRGEKRGRVKHPSPERTRYFAGAAGGGVAAEPDVPPPPVGAGWPKLALRSTSLPVSVTITRARSVRFM